MLSRRLTDLVQRSFPMSVRCLSTNSHSENVGQSAQRRGDPASDFRRRNIAMTFETTRGRTPESAPRGYIVVRTPRPPLAAGGRPKMRTFQLGGVALPTPRSRQLDLGPPAPYPGRPDVSPGGGRSGRGETVRHSPKMGGFVCDWYVSSDLRGNHRGKRDRSLARRWQCLGIFADFIAIFRKL